MEEGGQQDAGAAAPVFISYASSDAAVADALVAALESAGLQCWIAPRDVTPGAQYADEIVRALNASDVLLLVLSQRSAASTHVGREIERAASKGRRIIVLRTDTTSLPGALEYFLSASQWIDLKPAGTEAAAQKLVRAIREYRSPKSSFVSGTSRADRPAITGSLGPQSDKSVAVLPFIDLSEKKDHQYFSDGISEEILNLLGRIPGLRVIGRTSSFQFRGDAGDLRGIGINLGATYLVEGSVRPAAETVRVSARLIDSRDGVQRWSETYIRDANDMLKVQEEIAANLAAALQLEVSPHVISQLRSPPTVSEAYETYLRGLHAAYRFDQPGFEEAIARFRHALELDPTFAAPAEALAVTLNMLTEWQVLPPMLGFPQARSAAQLTLNRYPQSALARAILGNIATYFEFDRALAEAEIRSALALAPNNPVVLVIAAKERLTMGDWGEALRLLTLAQSMDPLQPAVLVTRGVVYQRLMRYSEAQRDFRRALAISPTYARVHSRIAEVFLAEGELEAALAEIRLESGGIRFRGLAVVLHAMGRFAESAQALAHLEQAGGPYMAMRVAEVCAFTERVDEAFDWLGKAYEQRDSTLSYIKGNPLFAAITTDERYKTFLRKLNLPD